MSLNLVRTWVTGMFSNATAARDAMGVFEQAASRGVEVTLIFGPALMKNGHCCLAHWTGDELATLKLSPSQQESFGIKQGTLYQDFEPWESPELPPLRRVSLTGVRVDDRRQHHSGKALSGVFTYETRETTESTVLRCALRAKSFRPWMPRRVAGCCHVNLVGRQGEAPFSFESPNPGQNPEVSPGPLVVFFQLVSIKNWSITDTWQRISNVLVRVVEIG
ncbi:MAG: hypothetical protein HY290_23945 [Planctomycetia bacterium]|nr:hypothetical protein [Planctomycetia bacterium]